jgi:hypothetical protein
MPVLRLGIGMEEGSRHGVNGGVWLYEANSFWLVFDGAFWLGLDEDG